MILRQAASTLFPERALKANPLASVNDHPDTTREDLNRVFDKAAEIWEERHSSS